MAFCRLHRSHPCNYDSRNLASYVMIHCSVMIHPVWRSICLPNTLQEEPSSSSHNSQTLQPNNETRNQRTVPYRTNMSLNEQYNGTHALWQAWQAQAKPSSRMGLLSDETIDPIVEAHMTLTQAPDSESGANRFSFILEECQLSDDEWERHRSKSSGFGFASNGNSGLALVPLRRCSHT